MYLKMEVLKKVELIHQNHCKVMSTLQTGMLVFFVRTMTLKQSCRLLALSKWVNRLSLILTSIMNWVLSCLALVILLHERRSTMLLVIWSSYERPAKSKIILINRTLQWFHCALKSEIHLKKDMYSTCQRFGKGTVSWPQRRKPLFLSHISAEKLLLMTNLLNMSLMYNILLFYVVKQ